MLKNFYAKTKESIYRIHYGKSMFDRLYEAFSYDKTGEWFIEISGGWYYIVSVKDPKRDGIESITYQENFPKDFPSLRDLFLNKKICVCAISEKKEDVEASSRMSVNLTGVVLEFGYWDNLKEVGSEKRTGTDG